MIIIACPNCSEELRFSDSDPRAVRTCSECGSEFRYHPDSSWTQEAVVLSTPTTGGQDPAPEAVDAPDPGQRTTGLDQPATSPPDQPATGPDPLLAQELADPPSLTGPLGVPPRHQNPFERLPVRPWRRYFARLLDIILAVLAVGIVLWNLIPDNDMLAGFLVMVVWIPIEAVLLSTWGTTPGKWMFATHIRTSDGDRLPFGAAAKRSADVWVRGLGLGIPLVSLITLMVGYQTLREEGRASWDAAAGWVVGHRDVGLPQIIALTVATGLVLVVLLFALVPGLAIEGDLIAAIEGAAASFEKQGTTVRFVGDIQTGELSSGEDVVLTAVLEEGVETLIYGVCDMDCLDLDLAVAGPAGEAIWVDEDPDAEPVAYFTPEAAGEHAITVSMYDCQLEPCYFALGVMALEGFQAGPSFGTCFAVSPDGRVMTAGHVVDSDEEIHVLFADGTLVDAEIERVSESHDVAILRTGRVSRDYLTFAGADALAPGEPVFTIGFPALDILGSEPKFTEGVISALSGPEGDDGLLQVSVPIQPGNSGGPLVNHAGEVVGVIVSTVGSRAFEAQTGALPQNVNWAVKGPAAALILDDPPAPLASTMRDDAILKAQAAVCLVQVGGEQEGAESAATPEGEEQGNPESAGQGDPEGTGDGHPEGDGR